MEAARFEEKILTFSKLRYKKAQSERICINRFIRNNETRRFLLENQQAIYQCDHGDDSNEHFPLFSFSPQTPGHIILNGLLPREMHRIGQAMKVRVASNLQVDGAKEAHCRRFIFVLFVAVFILATSEKT